MPSRPELTHPGDAAIEAAMSRTLTALTAVCRQSETANTR